MHYLNFLFPSYGGLEESIIKKCNISSGRDDSGKEKTNP